MGNSKPNLRYKSVLIIDDNELDLFITERLLRNGAHIDKLHTTQSPQNALSNLKLAKSATEMPDLIILDMKMPSFDGFAFLKELSGFPHKVVRRVDVVILSAHLNLEPELIDQTKKYPFVRKHLNKPLDVNQLSP